MAFKSYPAKTLFWAYLILIGLLGILLAGYATAPFGAGVGTDGVIQMSTAANLLKGRGLIDGTGAPFVRWPPLYPYLLAALSWLARLDTYTAGWYLNLLLMGVMIWLGGALLYAAFPDEPAWAWIGSLILASSVSLLSVSANIGTDPLFIAITLAFLLAAARYLATGSKAALFGMACLACLACLERLPGVTLTAAAALLILYTYRGRFRRGLLYASLFSIATMLPLAAWTIGHNVLQNHTLFGVYLSEGRYPLFNLQNSLDKIIHWFVPYNFSARVPNLLLAGIPALLLVFASKRQDWQRLGRRLARPPALAALLFAGLYLALLIVTANSVDTRYPYYDRYQIVIFVPALILIFAALQELVVSRFSRHPILARLIVWSVFAIWLIYPAYSLSKYIKATRLEGETTYNLYNTRSMRQSGVVKVLQEIGKDESQAIYSNYPSAAWFYTRQDVFASPRGEIVGNINIADLMQEYQDWPGDKPGYLVWFLPNEYDHVLTPAVLARIADLKPVYQGEDGEIYRVNERK